MAVAAVALLDEPSRSVAAAGLLASYLYIFYIYWDTQKALPKTRTRASLLLQVGKLLLSHKDLHAACCLPGSSSYRSQPCQAKLCP